MCRHHQLIAQCQFNYAKLQGKGQKNMGLLSKDLAFFIMDVKASHITLSEVILSPPCAQKKKWIPIGSKGWLQMQCDTPRNKGWERPNLVCNAMQKCFKIGKKKGQLNRLTNKRPHLVVHTTSSTFNTNQKVNKKGC
jgi:hypothetical protein